MLGQFQGDLVRLGTMTLDPNQAQVAAAEGMAKLTEKLDEIAEQDRRRQALYAPTMDNLNFLIDRAAEHRQFILYRADIATQWRQYIESQARSRLAKTPAQP